MPTAQTYDAIVLGAGGAGLMCAAVAGAQGKRVLVVDHADAPGKKILISGGGRCNFTNVGTAPDRFLSANPHFAKSALASYTARDFIDLVEAHRIPWHEKTLGQLFCDRSSKDIVALLLAALLQPGASGLVRRGWPRSLAAFTMLVVGLGVVAGIITLVIERFNAGFSDLAAQVSEGVGQVQTFIVRTFPITQGQLEDAVTQFQETLVDNQDTIASGALTTAATVGEFITGIVLALFTLFFFLKDGRTIWLWLVGLFPAESRAYVDEAVMFWRTPWGFPITEFAVPLYVFSGRRDGFAPFAEKLAEVATETHWFDGGHISHLTPPLLDEILTVVARA